MRHFFRQALFLACAFLILAGGVFAAGGRAEFAPVTATDEATAPDAQTAIPVVTAIPFQIGEPEPDPDTWTCPECGKENDSPFCRWCGAKKPEAPAAAFCPECGVRYDPEAGYLFCGECGARLPENGAPEPAGPMDALAGVWSLTDVTGADADVVERIRGQMAAGYELRYTLNRDGAFEAYVQFEYQQTNVSGAWTANDRQLTMTEEGSGLSDTIDYSFDGDRLLLSTDTYTLIFTGTKQP